MQKSSFANFTFEGKPLKAARDVSDTNSFLDGTYARGTIATRSTTTSGGGVDWKPDEEYSVVNKTASTYAFCCFGRWARLGCTKPTLICNTWFYSITFTRAQWLYLLNLACFVVHATLAYLSFTSCNATRFGTVINSECTASGMELDILRLRTNWTADNAGTVTLLVSNGKPVRFDFVVGWFFLLSAIFHLYVVVIGPSDRWASWYWGCIDEAFCYWRWIEYAASAPVMSFALFLLVGIRDENTVRIPHTPRICGVHVSEVRALPQLAATFVLMSITMFCGLFTELASRPAPRRIDGTRGWDGDPELTDEIGMILAKHERYLGRDTRRRRGIDPMTADRIRECDDPYERRQLERQLQLERDQPTPQPLNYREDYLKKCYLKAYRINYVKRMIPHVVGFIPYITVWVIFVNHFYVSLNDLKSDDEALFDLVPTWVVWAISGTIALFSSFTFVQIWFQYQTPDAYWKTEICYCILSLTAKLWLGLFLYMNVLRLSSFDDAMRDTPAYRRLRTSG